MVIKKSLKNWPWFVGLFGLVVVLVVGLAFKSVNPVLFQGKFAPSKFVQEVGNTFGNLAGGGPTTFADYRKAGLVKCFDNDSANSSETSGVLAFFGLYKEDFSGNIQLTQTPFLAQDVCLDTAQPDGELIGRTTEYDCNPAIFPTPDSVIPLRDVVASINRGNKPAIVAKNNDCEFRCARGGRCATEAEHRAVAGLEGDYFRMNKYVSESGDDANNGQPEFPYRHIQHAIDESEEGGTIHIEEGRYKEQLTIDKSLTLDGSGKDQTWIVYKIINGTIIYVNAPEVTIKDLSIGGGRGGEDVPPGERSETSATEGIHVENSYITIENVAMYDIRFAYINLYQSNFLIKDTELRTSEWRGYIDQSDLGINIADSEGIVDGLENDDTIDHIVDNHKMYYRLTDDEGASITCWGGGCHGIERRVDGSRDLVVRNSTFAGRNFDWGQSIRFVGNGDSEVLIENNVFRGDPAVIEELDNFQDFDINDASPQAMSLVGGQFTVTGNDISNYSLAIFLGNYRVRLKLFDNMIYDNLIGILTRPASARHGTVPDFGGGDLGSPGDNTFFGNRFFDIYHQDRVDWQTPDADIYAKHNNWRTNNPAEIEERIYDQNDDPEVGRVIWFDE